MEIYLIRHTRVLLPPHTCYGQTDVDTLGTFEQEAEVTRRNLQGIQFDHVFTSPLSRATKLAAWCGFPDAEREDRLKEMNMGRWEMKNFDEITEITIDYWYKHYMELQAPEGECFMDMYRRVTGFLEELKFNPWHRVALFCHGGPILCARLWAGQITKEDGFYALTDFGGIEQLTIDRCFNTQHINSGIMPVNA